MPAITALAISAAAPVGRALAALGFRLGRGLKRLADLTRHRRAAIRLADLDDRMLADIGLNRSDLRDACANLWHDPTDMLARRVDERRFSRRRAAFERSSRPDVAVARAGQPKALRYPPLDRPAQYLM